MDLYVERRLTSLHEAGLASKETVITAVIAVVTVCCIPVFHLGVIYWWWAPDKPNVNRNSCTCDCFDTVIRGRYEWPPSGYKHLYINSSLNSSKIWTLTVIGILIAYHSIRYITSLIYHGNVRRPFLVLLLLSVYPHYYGWWAIINYWNEDFYLQFNHQVYFSLTELVSSAILLHICNAQKRILPIHLLLVLVINLMHIIISGLDQFVTNVLRGHGQVFEAVRDVGLMTPDLLTVFVVIFELQILAQKRSLPLRKLFYKEEILMSVVLLTLGTVLAKAL